MLVQATRAAEPALTVKLGEVPVIAPCVAVSDVPVTSSEALVPGLVPVQARCLQRLKSPRLAGEHDEAVLSWWADVRSVGLVFRPVVEDLQKPLQVVFVGWFAGSARGHLRRGLVGDDARFARWTTPRTHRRYQWRR
jgi:hypothetical protein